MAYKWSVVRTTVKDNRELKNKLQSGWYVLIANPIGEELEYVLEYEYEEDTEGEYIEN